MAQQIQLRNGTAAQWTSANPTLALGELGVETDTNKFKVGTGTTAWNSLAYSVGFTWRGAWSSATAYTPNDLVTYSNATYIAVQPGTNQIPATGSSYWNVMVSGAGASVSPATPTAAGTVYGSTVGSNGGLLSIGYNSASSAGNYCVGVGSRSLGYAGPATGDYNTATGASALYSLTSGVGNSAFGYYSLGGHTTGNYNTAVGYDCLSRNTTASKNAALGANALRLNTTGTENTAVGYDALTINTTGGRNTGLGFGALKTNSTGYNNTAIGHSALSNSITDNNTAIGYQALYNLTTGGSDNTAVGYNALYTSTTSYINTAVGNQAMENLTTGAQNAAFGYRSLFRITTGQGNTALGAPYVSNGWYALQALTTGNYNTAVGGWAGNSITTGGYNVCVGTGSGGSTVLSTGSGNVCIGYEAAPSSSGATNQIVIGYSVTGQGDNYVTLGTYEGKIYNAFRSNATWTQTSDARLKTNVQNDSLGLSFINRLRPVTFNWKASQDIDSSLPYHSLTNGRDTETVIHGLIAQEVKAALDAEGCSTFNGWDGGNQDTVQGISREMFISPLIRAIQELSAEVASLKSQINGVKP